MNFIQVMQYEKSEKFKMKYIQKQSNFHIGSNLGFSVSTFKSTVSTMLESYFKNKSIVKMTKVRKALPYENKVNKYPNTKFDESKNFRGK